MFAHNVLEWGILFEHFDQVADMDLYCLCYVSDINYFGIIVIDDFKHL